MSDEQTKLNESVQYFEDFINLVLPQNIEGVKPMELMKHYNVLRTELSKLYVDTE